MAEKTPNQALLDEAAKNPFTDVLFTTDQEINVFLNSINIEVDEAGGEKVIGKLNPLQLAYLMKIQKLTNEIQQKINASKKLKDANKKAELQKVRAEIDEQLKYAELLKEISSQLVFKQLAQAGVEIETVAYRKGGVIVSIPEEEHEGIFLAHTPFGMAIGMRIR